MGTFKESLNPWINPVIDSATPAGDSLLTDVRKKKTTIYIGTLPNKLAESRVIVNLLFFQLINQSTRELLQDSPDLKHQYMLLMDGFINIGKAEIIAHPASYVAGYNIHLLPITQSVAQLDAAYGKEYVRTIITNHALQTIYIPRERQDVNEYSEMLGCTIVKRKNASHGRERSVSESEGRRVLMSSQELKAMSQDKEIILHEGMSHLAQVGRTHYYQDGTFTKRLVGLVKVALLKGKW